MAERERNIVPKNDKESGIGRSDRYWGRGYFDNLFVNTHNLRFNSTAPYSSEEDDYYTDSGNFANIRKIKEDDPLSAVIFNDAIQSVITRVDNVYTTINTTLEGDYLSLSGGTMNGSIDLNSNSITNADDILTTSLHIGTNGSITEDSEGKLDLNGIKALNSSLIIPSTLTVAGISIFNSSVTLRNTLTVDDNVAVSKNLNVGQNITATGTITGAKVFNAVYNDYAEFFPRGEETEVGDIIALDENSNEERYIKATSKSKMVVGIHSEDYAHIIGGMTPKDNENELQANIKDYIPIALAGRVLVRFKGKSEIGGYVTPSTTPGVGQLSTKRTKNVVGRILTADDRVDERYIKVLVIN